MNSELVEAINDTIFMFKDIKQARELPPYAQVHLQYIALGNKLEALMKIEQEKEINQVNVNVIEQKDLDNLRGVLDRLYNATKLSDDERRDLANIMWTALHNVVKDVDVKELA